MFTSGCLGLGLVSSSLGLGLKNLVLFLHHWKFFTYVYYLQDCNRTTSENLY